jgi:putative ABC transport system permease protein
VGSLFLFIGSFAIIAGVLLLVNVFVMLAEERKGELGMLRAVGMRRGRLVRGFVVEGAVYSLVAAAVGLAAGLGVGRAVVAVTARIFAGFSPEEGGIDLVFTATPTSLVNGFAAGFLIGFVTVALTSIRISRVNIIAAIRDLPPCARCWSGCCPGGPSTPAPRWPCSAGAWPPTPCGPRCSTTAPRPPSS